MKKIIVLALCLLFTLTACDKTDVPDNSQSTVKSGNSDASSATVSSEQTTDEPPALHEITDSRITQAENTKAFSHLGISLNAPSDWECLEINGEDGSVYFFRHPELGEKCQFSFKISAAELFTKPPTEDEYAKYLTDIYSDFEIYSFTKEIFKGSECTKIVSTYSADGEQFIKTEYNYLIIGIRIYNVSAVYPSADKDEFGPIFDSIFNSIKFSATD